MGRAGGGGDHFGTPDGGRRLRTGARIGDLVAHRGHCASIALVARTCASTRTAESTARTRASHGRATRLRAARSSLESGGDDFGRQVEFLAEELDALVCERPVVVVPPELHLHEPPRYQRLKIHAVQCTTIHRKVGPDSTTLLGNNLSAF